MEEITKKVGMPRRRLRNCLIFYGFPHISDDKDRRTPVSRHLSLQCGTTLNTKHHVEKNSVYTYHLSMIC